MADAKRGNVYFQRFPLVYGEAKDQQHLWPIYRQQFRIDSKLVVVYGSRENDGKGLYFYSWVGSRFKLLRAAVKKD